MPNDPRVLDATGIPVGAAVGKTSAVERRAEGPVGSLPAIWTRAPSALTASELRTWAEVAIASGRFRDSRDVAQAMIKMKAGAELGLPPIASMMGIHVIEGKTAISAVMMAGLIQRSGRFRYRVTRLTDVDPKPPGGEPAGCTIEFFEKIQDPTAPRFEIWDSCGVPSTFTTADALKAGLLNKDNWRKWRRNMLFGRALSNGARWYCASVFQGAPVYVPEELGATVNEEGEFVAGPTPQRGEEPDLSPPTVDITSLDFVKHRLTQRFALRWTNDPRLTVPYFGVPCCNDAEMRECAEETPDAWLAGCTMLAEQD